MKLLVGSRATVIHFPDFRDPKDTDYFVSTPEEGKHQNTPEGRVENLYHPRIAKWMNDNFISIGGCKEFVATPDQLYTIKVSHSFWALRNGTWNKHMRDILFLQEKGCVLIPDLYNVLYETWVEMHGAKKANLNATPEEFFNSNVDRLYDHDSIHRSVAYYDSPLFESILRDGHAVAVDRSKFDNLSHEDKCKLLREEVYATALERVLIPSDFTKSPRGAYNYALMKTITSFSKGWFPLWVVLNYKDVHLPDVDYVQRFKDNADKLILLEA